MVDDNDAFLELLGHLRTVEGIDKIEALPYLGLTKQTYDWGVGGNA